MTAFYPRDLDDVKRLGLGSPVQKFCASLPPMRKRRETAREQTSQRLRETREALGYADHAAEFARKADITPKAYNNFENGYRPGLNAAILLCEEYGLSLDWIYFGETSAFNNMPAGTADKLRDFYARRSGENTKGGNRPFRNRA